MKTQISQTRLGQAGSPAVRLAHALNYIFSTYNVDHDDAAWDAMCIILQAANDLLSCGEGGMA